MPITENVFTWRIIFSGKPEWISWGYLVTNDYIFFLINLSHGFLTASLLSCTLWLCIGQECWKIMVEWLAVTVMAFCD